jgi:hypothetical protein
MAARILALTLGIASVTLLFAPGMNPSKVDYGCEKSWHFISPDE